MKRIYIDMDGVLCNYKLQFLKWLEANPKIPYPQTQYGFYLSLPEIEESIASLYELEKHYDVWILTRPSWQNPLCYTEKRVWVEEHFTKEFCKKLIICYDKSLLIGDYLIDDNYYEDFEGTSLLFGSDEFPDWKSILAKLVPTYTEKWNGHIAEIDGKELYIRLYSEELQNGYSSHEAESTILKNRIKFEQKEWVKLGQILTWQSGQNGFGHNVTSINLMEPRAWTSEEIKEVEEKAAQMMKDLKWD